MAGTAAKKAKKGEGGRSAGGKNYVVRSQDGKLFVASGKTGTVAAVKKRHLAEIESLIEQRQALGVQLSKLLEKEGYVVAPTFPTIIIEAGGKDKS